MASGHAESWSDASHQASFEKILAEQAAPWASKPASATALDHLDSERISVPTQAEQEEVED
jgi:hypothetical protein